jgi:hypothetical protein
MELRVGLEESFSWTPLAVNGLVAWYDARFPTDITLTSGAVSTWANHAGSGGTSWNVTDGASSVRRPAYTSGISVDFDGTSDRLSTAGTSPAQPVTVVMKALCANDSANMYIADGNGFNTRVIHANTPVTGVLRIYAGTTDMGNVLITGGVAFKCAGVFNGASSALYVQGQTTQTGNAGAASAAGISLGGAGNNSLFTHGSIYWVCVYDRALTSVEINTVFRLMP